MKQLEFDFSNKRLSKKRKVFSFKTNKKITRNKLSDYEKILTEDEYSELRHYLSNMKHLRIPSKKAEMAYLKLSEMMEKCDGGM